MKKRDTPRGFTIVELLIVIVVIAILAAITIVAFNGIQKRASLAAVQSDLRNAATQLGADFATTGSYPVTLAAANGGQGIPTSSGIVLQYTVTGSEYCITGVSSRAADAPMIISSTTQAPKNGACSDFISESEKAAAIAAGNQARSSTITSSIPWTEGGAAYVTDGITSNGGQYLGISQGVQWIRVDLGSLKPVGKVVVWHYYQGPARSYLDPKTEVSADGTNWFTIYDGAVSGQYAENVNGQVMVFTPRKIRYIRDQINGNNINRGNHWTEIQAFYQ